MEVEVTWKTNTVFKGSIESIAYAGNHVPQATIKCVDFSQLIDKRIVFDSFVDTLSGDIVKDLITNFFAVEGITAGEIQDGALINKVVYNYQTGNDVMNELAETSGFNWYIDDLKRLNFYDRSTFSSDIEITDDGLNYANMSVTRNRAKYRNRQYVRAGTDTTELILKERPSPKPDAESRTFTLRFPVADKPLIYVNGVQVPDNQVGVNGLDEGRDYYFSYNSQTITQDSNLTELQVGDSIEVDYRGLYPIIVTADESDEISERQDIEGNSGIYEQVAETPKINDRQTALSFAQGKLDKYGAIQNIVKFDTYDDSIKAGQLITVQSSKFDLDGTYLIESVNARAEEDLIRYTVKCLDGQALGGWEQFFKALVPSGSKIEIREGEVLVLLNTMNERQGWSETSIQTVNACPIPGREEVYFLSRRQLQTFDSPPFPEEDLYPC